MKNLRRWLLALGWAILAQGAQGALTPEQARMLPPPATGPVVFSRDIQPIFEASCVKCHGRGRNKGGFQLDTRETVLKGGDSGPAAVPGKSEASLLIALVAGVDPDEVMPRKGTRLTPDQVGRLRAWIDRGLPWDAGITLARPAPLNLTPRAPKLPLEADSTLNPVDQILRPYFATNQPALPPVIDDRGFARRAYLDVIGLLPPPGELEAFIADSRPDKRAQLVRRLLADNQRYAEHWLSFWNDLLRNDYRGTGYIDGGRRSITAWLFAALATNMTYDRFVAQLVNPSPATEGFVKGIIWRGVVNASQSPPLQAAQNVSQVFMGVNLKCASCHDSFINDWRLSDAYGLASIYNDGPLEMFQCDKPTGQKAQPRFLYPELGDVEASAPQSARMERLSQIMTSRQNGRLSRTIVNRLWARFFGHGLVEPVDDMEQPVWNPDLLDWLAEDLVTSGYDLKHTMERMLTSQAYQLPAVSLGEAPNHRAYVFRGPAVRRLTAEQFRDALGQITGAWYAKADFPGSTRQIRASLVAADPLTTALGRPNRDQVITSRATTATTLQALELTNGATLAEVLEAGAAPLVGKGQSADQLLAEVYQQALGRKPTPAESQAALGLLGSSPQKEGVEDLLWAVTMLPEFQLVY